MVWRTGCGGHPTCRRAAFTDPSIGRETWRTVGTIWRRSLHAGLGRPGISAGPTLAAHPPVHGIAKQGTLHRKPTMATLRSLVRVPPEPARDLVAVPDPARLHPALRRLVDAGTVGLDDASRAQALAEQGNERLAAL